MLFQKSENPGSHERHLLRRSNKLLFQTKQSIVDDDSLMEAQKKDHEEIVQFHEIFNRSLNDTIKLDANVESDVILELKDRLERLYEQAFRIGDDQSEIKEAIRKLLAVIMASVRKGAGSDAQAHQELDQEEAARQAHFQLLESSLVADLLDPNSVIDEDDLLPTLLSATKDELAKVLQLFDESQLIVIVESGDVLLRGLIEQGHDVSDAMENIAFIQGYIEFLSQQN